MRVAPAVRHKEARMLEELLEFEITVEDQEGGSSRRRRERGEDGRAAEPVA